MTMSIPFNRGNCVLKEVLDIVFRNEGLKQKDWLPLQLHSGQQDSNQL